MSGGREGAVYEKACAFLLEQRIDNLPVNPFDIIARARWGLVTYRRLSELLGPGAEDIAGLCGSADGFTIYNGRSYCIAYNSGVGSFGRLAFTLMHEIAHIVLGHFIQYDQEAVSPRLLNALEQDANLFASCVLAPSVAIARLRLDTPELLRSAFGLSQSAAVRRLRQFALWRPTEADRFLERRLEAYFKLNAPPRAKPLNLQIQRDDEAVTAAD